MTKTYITSQGDMLVEDIPGMSTLVALRDPETLKGMIIDTRIIERLINNGSFKLKIASND